MHRVLYTLEDYFEDRALENGSPRWIARLMRALARTFGEAGDLVAFHW
jgi:hypothetical protein